MNLYNISIRIAALYGNMVSDDEIIEINRALRYLSGTDIVKLLNKYDLAKGKTHGKSATLHYKKLSIPVRNAYLWVENGQWSIKKRSQPHEYDAEYMERAIGPFTKEPEESQ